MEDNSLNIIVTLQDDASEGMAEMAAAVTESMEEMAESAAATTIEMEESFNELAEIMAVDAADISDEAIGVGLSFDEMAAQITADTTIAETEMAEMDATTAASTGNIRSNLIQLGIAAGIPFAALVSVMKGAVSAADDWNQVSAVVGTTLKDTGSSIPLEQVQDYAKAMQQSTLYTQQNVMQAAELVLSNKDMQGSYQDVLSITADLATKMQTDMPTAARILTNALADPATGISQLERAMNANFSPAVIEMVQNLSKAGDVAGADALIMKELNGTVGGAAAAAHNAADGADKLGQDWNGLSTVLGNALIPALDKLVTDITPLITELSNWIAAHPKLTEGILATTVAITGFFTLVAGIGIYVMAASAGMTALATIAGTVSTAFEALSSAVTISMAGVDIAILPIVAILGTLALAIDKVTQSYQAMEGAMKSASDAAKNGDAIADKLTPLIAKATGPEKQKLETIQQNAYSSDAQTESATASKGAFNDFVNALQTGPLYGLFGGSKQTTQLPGLPGNQAGYTMPKAAPTYTFNFAGPTVGDQGIQQIITKAMGNINRTTTLRTMAGAQ